MVLAHGANKDRIGTNQIDDKDADGKEFVKAAELPAILQIHEPGDQVGRAEANVLQTAV